ncbi:MAG: S8 family serine peptidase [Candidatus Omnitrophica bacterium]|nr:S8 family serine peptidase [Candidatus Omnitrophota bacterium]
MTAFQTHSRRLSLFVAVTLFPLFMCLPGSYASSLPADPSSRHNEKLNHPFGLCDQFPKQTRIVVRLKSDAAGRFKNQLRKTSRGKSLRQPLEPLPSLDGIAPLVELNARHRIRKARRLIRKNLRRLQQHPELEDSFVLEVDASAADLLELCRGLRKHADVAWAEPDLEVKTTRSPNDPYYSSSGSWGQSYGDQWGLQAVHAAQAWDRSTGNSNITVAVVDTGFDMKHADRGTVWRNPGEIANNGRDDDNNGYVDDLNGWDFTQSDNTPVDGAFHGTHVSGIIGAATNNGRGMAGVMWQSSVMPLKGLADNGVGYSSWLAEAIIYAVDNGARVINNSWAGNGVSQTLESAIDYAAANGVVVVASASNDGADLWLDQSIPASYPYVIAVGSVGPDSRRSYFSNFGAGLDVLAPGEQILSLLATDGQDPYGGSATVGNYYLRLSGTSMAAPHVAGVAGLILSRRPQLSAQEVRQILRSSAADLNDPLGEGGNLPGFDLWSGYGVLDANAALQIDQIATVEITSPSNYTTLKGTATLRAQTQNASGWQAYHQSLWLGQWTRIAGGSGSSVAVPLDMDNLGPGDHLLQVRASGTGATALDTVLVRGPRLYADEMATRYPASVALGAGESSSLGDVDGDGDLDILGCQSTTGTLTRIVQNFLLINDGTGHFTDQSLQRFRFLGSTSSTANELADMDNDGDLDMIGTNGDSVVVMYNDGAGYFRNTNTAFTLTAIGSITLLAEDFDGDGDRDVFVSRWGADPGEQNQLFLNYGGIFVDQTLNRLPRALTQDRGADAADVDGDGDLDLYLALSAADQLWLNNGSAYFSNRTSTRMPGMPADISADAVFFDADGDGDKDLFVSTIGFSGAATVPERLWINSGQGSFVLSPNALPDAGDAYSMVAAAVDVDNDGAMDIFSGHGYGNARSNVVLRNEGGRFSDITTVAIPPDANWTLDADAGDLTGDGRPDILLTNIFGEDALLVHTGQSLRGGGSGGADPAPEPDPEPPPPSPDPPAAGESFGWEFDTAGDFEGWESIRSLSNEVVSGGRLRAVVSGTDPHWRSAAGYTLDTDLFRTLRIGYTLTSSDAVAQFMWAEGDLMPGSGGRWIEFVVTADGSPHEVAVDLSAQSTWTGIATQFRLDPLKAPELGDAVSIDYIRFSDEVLPALPTGGVWEFNKSGDAEGWMPVRSLSNQEVRSGFLHADISGTDPHWRSAPGQNINASQQNTLQLGYRMWSNDRMAAFMWAAGSDVPGGGGKRVEFPVIADGTLREVSVYLGSNALWSGVVSQVRLDPLQSPETGDSVDIDYVRLIQSSATPAPAGVWEFNESGNFEGWISVRSLGSEAVSAGQLRAVVTGTDPHWRSAAGLEIDSARKTRVEIRYTLNSSDALMQFMWAEGTLMPGSGGRWIEFPVIADGNPHTAAVDLSQKSTWSGIVTRVRLDPLKNPAPGDSVAIDYIRIVEP